MSGEDSLMGAVVALIEDQRYHSPGCTDRVTSHTWESSGKACGTAEEIGMAPKCLREEWVRDRVAELAGSRAEAVSVHVEQAVAASFRPAPGGFVSRADGGPASCPPYVIASIAAGGRIPAGSVTFPGGCDAEVLERIKTITGFRGEDVTVSARQATELAVIGRQILELDRIGQIRPPLGPYEKQAVTHLVALVAGDGCGRMSE